MFINIMQYPPIPTDQEEKFRQWFKWTNQEYAKQPGFISRRLLKARKQGTYAAIVEHESYDTFLAMHKSPTQAIAHERLSSILDGGPTAQFYELIEA
jgi:heme-degrading monooxygenase HmoA